MFDFLKKNFELTAPIDGKIIDLSQVPDQVFSERMAGDGVAIDTTGDMVLAPADGTVVLILKTNHAFGMVLKNGTELLVHVGVDTIELNGEGLERLVEEGMKVKVGDPMIRLDRKFIEERGYSLITSIIITNSETLKDIKYNTGKTVKAGKNELIMYRIK
ncbi:PTS glucose transporter subunit IIA [Clostridium sp. WILCCON 0269]|uniref:PTS glucose transporter subunit IIA n=1 Tax=Candidatus Clostridium eludens TaxID=3381663 RepID=A0ABW8SJB4_9CLOT